MLQIITGKFYGNNDRHSTQCRGILYSNFAWGKTIETKIVKIEPVEVYGPVSSYVISYINELEQETEFKGFSLVKVGDHEIMQQFKLLASFGLQAYFDNDRSTVQSLCRKEKLHNGDDVIPSTFTRRFLNYGIMGTQNEIDDFISFIDKVLGLERNIYKKIISCISAFDTALKTVDQDLNLAYSIMIYSLETLSQSFDDYQAKWEDYDQNQRNKLDKILQDLTQEKSTEIKNVLITSAHLRLTKRFVEFTKKENPKDKEFENEYSRELAVYKVAATEILKHNKKLPNTKELLEEIDSLQEKKNTLMKEYSESKNMMNELFLIRKNFKQYMGKEMER